MPGSPPTRITPLPSPASTCSNGRRTLASLAIAPYEAGLTGCLLQRSIERLVLGQHRRLELPQRVSRLDPQLIHERTPQVTISLECVRLAAPAVERDHQLAAESLAQRMLRDERLELGDQLRVTAELEVRLDPLLEGGRGPQLLEPRDVGLQRLLDR